MKKLYVILLILMLLALVSCIQQTVKTESRFLDDYTFEEVWKASIRAVNDIEFTIDSLDKDAGFIGAESGPHIGQDAPPRLSIMITEARGRVYVNCKVLQKEEFIDVFGHGRRTIRKFMVALNRNLDIAY
ncbi:MAG: hypothetical protein JSV96_01415 [Candidatus Aminicenantes bacterium]|nr:MAG: hypothetical protein JSV96_01415 [Candidatus Aminicenantes bacterium]